MSRPVSLFLGSWLALSAAGGAQVNGPLPQPLPLFPADNWWNLDISAAPTEGLTRTNEILAAIGGDPMHPDFGGDDTGNPPAIYGMPYITVPGSQPLVPVTFLLYGNQSDDGAPCQPPGFPIPEEAKTQSKWIEGGQPGGGNSGDRHMLIVDRDNRLLYELYQAHWNTGLTRWEAGSAAVWPLGYNSRRPDGWTSADAAGMAILPGLVRHDEAYPSQPSPPPIQHAFRVTVDGVYGYVFPASHLADTGATTAPPLGTRLRLKSSKIITGYPAHIQRIFQAMKTYGLIVADTGSSMYVQGTYNPAWNNDELNPYFDDLHASDFDVIQLGWKPANYPILPEGDWCPWHPVPREEFAVYLLRALESQSYMAPTPSCAGGFPTDVPCPSNQYSRWIEELRDRNIGVDCAAGLYCPKSPLTHAQLAVNLLRAKHPGMTDPACTSTDPFVDLSCSDDSAGWIMQAKAEGLVSGCDATHFCPGDAVTRVELEQLLARSF